MVRSWWQKVLLSFTYVTCSWTSVWSNLYCLFEGKQDRELEKSCCTRFTCYILHIINYIVFSNLYCSSKKLLYLEKVNLKHGTCWSGSIQHCLKFLHRFQRMVEVGRDFWRSPGPTPAPAGPPRAGCTGPCLISFGRSPSRRTHCLSGQLLKNKFVRHQVL